MRNFSILFFLLFFVLSNISCQNTKKRESSFTFNDLTFYSSACNGLCPDITMNLSSSKKIQLIRTIYSGKGEVDTLSSGGFKGELKKGDYSKIVDLMSKIDWDTVSFPAITCCDGPVVTIMISYNNTYKSFTSMAPPHSTDEFITYLTDFLTHVSLPGYDKPMDFETPYPPPIKQ